VAQVAVLVYARFVGGRTASELSGGYIPLFYGPFPDFNNEWYSVVGAQIIIVAALHGLRSAIKPGLKLAWASVLRQLSCCWPRAVRRAVTQREFTRAWIAASGQFELAPRYGHMLTTTCGCLVLSSGMPILLGVASVILCITYWADRHSLLRLSRRPPPYSGHLANTAIAGLEYALLMHILVGVWMYSAADPDGSPMLPRPYSGIVSTGLVAAADGAQRVAARVLSDLTLPLIVLAIITIGYMFYRRLLDLSCSRAAEKARQLETSAQQTYQDALKTRLPGFEAGYDLSRIPPYDQVLPDPSIPCSREA
jgi:hypothetical protein